MDSKEPGALESFSLLDNIASPAVTSLPQSIGVGLTSNDNQYSGPSRINSGYTSIESSTVKASFWSKGPDPFFLKEVREHWLTESDPDGGRTGKTLRQRLSQQSASLVIYLVITAVVLILNVVVTIWASLKYPAYQDIGTVYEGSCANSQRLVIVIHLFVNVLSTILLAASNSCMRILVAPTWDDAVETHSRRRWLDIGIVSWKNLKIASKPRVVVWSILAVSSITLHLL